MNKLFGCLLCAWPFAAQAQDAVFAPDAGFSIVTALDAGRFVVRNNNLDFICSLTADAESATLHGCLPITHADSAPLTLETLAAVPLERMRALVFDTFRDRNCVLDMSDPDAMELAIIMDVARRLGESGPLSPELTVAIGDTFDVAFEGQNEAELFEMDENAKTLTLRDC